jgi:hypothetical protein
VLVDHLIVCGYRARPERAPPKRWELRRLNNNETTPQTTRHGKCIGEGEPADYRKVMVIPPRPSDT